MKQHEIFCICCLLGTIAALRSVARSGVSWERSQKHPKATPKMSRHFSAAGPQSRRTGRLEKLGTLCPSAICCGRTDEVPVGKAVLYTSTPALLREQSFKRVAAVPSCFAQVDATMQCRAVRDTVQTAEEIFSSDFAMQLPCCMMLHVGVSLSLPWQLCTARYALAARGWTAMPWSEAAQMHEDKADPCFSFAGACACNKQSTNSFAGHPFVGKPGCGISTLLRTCGKANV